MYQSTAIPCFGQQLSGDQNGEPNWSISGDDNIFMPQRTYLPMGLYYRGSKFDLTYRSSLHNLKTFHLGWDARSYRMFG
jgi:hypothetical protein